MILPCRKKGLFELLQHHGRLAREQIVEYFRSFTVIDSQLAEIYIASDNNPTVNYSYGGTRMVLPDTEESEIEQI